MKKYNKSVKSDYCHHYNICGKEKEDWEPYT